jgi:hypothetical protein
MGSPAEIPLPPGGAGVAIVSKPFCFRLEALAIEPEVTKLSNEQLPTPSIVP